MLGIITSGFTYINSVNLHNILTYKGSITILSLFYMYKNLRHLPAQDLLVVWFGGCVSVGVVLTQGLKT